MAEEEIETNKGRAVESSNVVRLHGKQIPVERLLDLLDCHLEGVSGKLHAILQDLDLNVADIAAQLAGIEDLLKQMSVLPPGDLPEERRRLDMALSDALDNLEALRKNIIK